MRDLEFFDDGTILIAGVVANESIVGNVPSTPVVVRLTQDGVLDDTYAQQGILVGTFNQFFGPNSALEATIDDAGRVLLLGTNQLGSSSDPQNFVSFVWPPMVRWTVVLGIMATCICCK